MTRHVHASHTEEPIQAASTTEVVDPVCGMTISPADAVGTADYKGHTYHFCSERCMELVQDNPGRFLGR